MTARSGIPGGGSDQSELFRVPGITVGVFLLTVLFLLCLPL